jgi:hypothetical protein
MPKTAARDTQSRGTQSTNTQPPGSTATGVTLHLNDTPGSQPSNEGLHDDDGFEEY